MSFVCNDDLKFIENVNGFGCNIIGDDDNLGNSPIDDLTKFLNCLHLFFFNLGI